MTAPVFLTEPGGLSEVSAGGDYLLQGTEARHAGVVQRRNPGERVDVVDCRGVRLVGVVESVCEEGVRLRVNELVAEPPPNPRVVLVQALAKGDRDEMAIEAATEVGVDAVIPWQAERSIVIWRGDRAAKSRSRWLGTVRAAAKQSRRAFVPEVATALDRDGLVRRTAEVVAAGGTVLMLHEEADLPLTDVPLPTAGSAAEVLIVVGPEGGISPAELAGMVGAGAVAVRLGPNVLRTSTAGPVAVALVVQRLGRWA